MKKIEVHNRVSDFNSYRAARVKSLFNAENGCNFDLEVDADLDFDWHIGVVVGPSGSGKTSIGKIIFGDNKIYDYHDGWAHDKPIIDCIAPGGDFNEVTGALANVGLGDVPAWLRPFHVLSNGEQFRAGLARIVCEKPQEIVIDEFTSVIDRQIAKIGSQAFQKAWRRNNSGKCVLLTPHYDILEWIQPDWVIDTKTKTFEKVRLRRPDIVLDIFKVDKSYWRFYKPHYYLDLPEAVNATHYIGVVDGELACHVVIAPFFQCGGYRMTRLVTMPEWQGAGVGSKFLTFMAQYALEGKAKFGRKLPAYFHTSHPQLCRYLRASKKWVQVSGELYRKDGRKALSVKRKSAKTGSPGNMGGALPSGAGVQIHRGKIGGKLDPKTPVGKYGGHFRAVQGFKYIGA